MHQGGYIGHNFQGGGSHKGTLTEGDLPRGDFSAISSLNGDPSLNMWE